MTENNLQIYSDQFRDDDFKNNNNNNQKEDSNE
jgi:hypothetical protein